MSACRLVPCAVPAPAFYTFDVLLEGVPVHTAEHANRAEALAQAIAAAKATNTPDLVDVYESVAIDWQMQDALDRAAAKAAARRFTGEALTNFGGLE